MEPQKTSKSQSNCGKKKKFFFQQRSQELIMGKDCLLNKWCLDSHIQKRETGPLLYSIQKSTQNGVET